MVRLYAATGNSIARLEENGNAWTVEQSWSGAVRSASPPIPVIPTPCTPDCGKGACDDGRCRPELDRLRAPGARRFLAGRERRRRKVYAGTEPSRLFGSDDRGETWRELEALLELPSRPTWRFPPRPWTSHVRWIAPSPHEADILLVGIELGGLMRSQTAARAGRITGRVRSRTCIRWPGIRARRGGPTRRGAAAPPSARTRGENWQPADEGRDRHYTWSVAVDPEDPECWYVSASTGPFAAHGRRDPQARHLP